MIDAPHVKKSYFRVRKSSKFLAALVFTIFLLPYLPNLASVRLWKFKDGGS